MKIDYRETTNDLLTRIDIHSRFGSREIDSWMLEVLNPQKGIHILDVGCGAGKLCFSFHDFLGGECEIIGGDVNEELLNKARSENQKRRTSIPFVYLDFNKPFPYPDNYFDLVSCSFAIYYSQDIPLTIYEMRRVLKPGGHLFTTGPMPENKHKFYEIIKKATGLPIPPMPGSSRYSSTILTEMKKVFSSVMVEIFENPLVFEKVEPFLDYTRASLSEDRKLWQNFFKQEDDFKKIIQKIAETSKLDIAENGKIVMTKVVGGFICIK